LGKDRTGTVIACYRIVHDKWPNARALTEAVDNGLNFTEHGMKTYIKNFQAPASLAKEQDATLPVHP
jgi:protein tyrosine/serine phosphatase